MRKKQQQIVQIWRDPSYQDMIMKTLDYISTRLTHGIEWSTYKCIGFIKSQALQTNGTTCNPLNRIYQMESHLQVYQPGYQAQWQYFAIQAWGRRT